MNDGQKLQTQHKDTQRQTTRAQLLISPDKRRLWAAAGKRRNLFRRNQINITRLCTVRYLLKPRMKWSRQEAKTNTPKVSPVGPPLLGCSEKHQGYGR